MKDLLLIPGLVASVLLITEAARRLRVSAPLLLLAVGAAGSYLPFVHVPELEPELVLVVLLPPLLYAAALNTSLIDFKNYRAPIGWLSIGSVLFTTAGVGLVAAWLLPIPWAAAFALGAIVAPPDAVAATAVARQAGLPRRVVTILEGESLVNDATALVSLRTAIAGLMATVTVIEVGIDFAAAVAIGIGAGYLVGKLATLVFRQISETMIVTAMSFLVPFFAFALAETFHASGVLAVVTSGLIVGHVTPVVKSAPARIASWMNWGTVQFVLEHLVFLLIGLQTKQILAEANEFPVGNGWIALTATVVLVTTMALRLIYILGIRRFLGQRHRRLPWQESAIIGWAGMRGVVTLAAALTLPTITPMRPVLVLIALVVTAGTLFIQGLSLPWVARRLRLRGPDPREDALQVVMVSQRAARSGLAEAARQARPGDEGLLRELAEHSKQRIDGMWERLGHRPGEDVSSETRGMAYRRLRMASLQAERDTVIQLRNQGFADAAVLAQVLAELDIEESMLNTRETAEREIRASRPDQSLDAPCPHLGATTSEIDVLAHGECVDCLAQKTEPVELRMCLTCGQVACCDSSPGQHAALHFRRTGHPVMRSIEPGERWRWCYVDNLHDPGEND